MEEDETIHLAYLFHIIVALCYRGPMASGKKIAMLYNLLCGEEVKILSLCIAIIS